MKKLVFAAVAVAFAFPAFAQMAPYSTFDTNKDGMLSAEEIKAGMPEMTDDMMMKADTNKDKMISEEEYKMMEGK